MSSQQWTSEGTHCEHSESSKNTEIGMGVRRRNKSGRRNRSRSPHRQWPSRKEGSPWQLPTSIWNEMFNVWNTSIAQLGQLSWIFSSLVLSWTCSWTVGKSFVPLAIAKISISRFLHSFHTKSKTLESYLKKLWLYPRVLFYYSQTKSKTKNCASHQAENWLTAWKITLIQPNRHRIARLIHISLK